MNYVAPMLDTSCIALLPEGAFAPWGGPAALNSFVWRLCLNNSA